LSSITGEYAFNLSKIKDFSLYFWKPTDEPSIYESLKLLLDKIAVSSPVNCLTYYKEQTLDALTQYTTYLHP
jgi:hypothetical protein